MVNTLDDWLAYIERLHQRPIDLGLDRVRAVAAHLDINLRCPVIVVGGTNGKGSTCAMLASILRAAGYRVGVYTSPHLLRFNERVQINGTPAGDEELVGHLRAVEEARGTTSLTYFEFTTLAILRLLAGAALDAAVLEIGLGGRLDAVNIVDADCAVLTAVDLDHMDFLGPTRERIGWEKAHIFRAGRPAICADPQPPMSVRQVANELGADLWQIGRDFRFRAFAPSRGTQQWTYSGRSQRRASLPYPALRGVHQLANAAGALAALEVLSDRLSVTQQAVRQGLLTVSMPGRFQVLPGRPAVILDVAHNPHATAALAASLDRMGFHTASHAVFGMLRDKDVAGVIAALGSRIDHWHVGPTPGARGLAAEDLAATLRRAGATSISVHPSIARAYRYAREVVEPDARIIVFGSFITVAAAMTEERRLRERERADDEQAAAG